MSLFQPLQPPTLVSPWLSSISYGLARRTRRRLAGWLLNWLCQPRPQTDACSSTVVRITKLALLTGAGPMLFAIVILIAFVAKPNELSESLYPCSIIPVQLIISLVATGIAMPIGSVYACTMLYTLNRRGYLRGDGISSFRQSALDPRASSSLDRSNQLSLKLF